MALAWKAGWVNSPQGFESPILRHAGPAEDAGTGSRSPTRRLVVRAGHASPPARNAEDQAKLAAASSTVVETPVPATHGAAAPRWSQQESRSAPVPSHLTLLPKGAGRTPPQDERTPENAREECQDRV